VPLPTIRSSKATSGSSNVLEQLDELVQPHDVTPTAR
jgi:hypothetical protein